MEIFLVDEIFLRKHLRAIGQADIPTPGYVFVLASVDKMNIIALGASSTLLQSQQWLEAVKAILRSEETLEEKHRKLLMGNLNEIIQLKSLVAGIMIQMDQDRRDQPNRVRNVVLQLFQNKEFRKAIVECSLEAPALESIVNAANRLLTSTRTLVEIDEDEL